MLLRPPCCAIVLLLLLPVIGICRAQSVDFRQPNQMSKSQIGGIGGAGAGPTGGVHPAQQQKSNLNLYDPMLTLYGHQQQHYGRSSANNGTWSAVGIGNFGTAPMPPLLTDAANGTTMALMQQQQQRNAAEVGRTANAGHGAVQVQVQLRSYANQGFRLPDGRLCTCPAGNERCLHASPQRNGYNCLTSLAVFVLSADDTIHFEETPYFPLNAAGQLGQQQEFGAPLRFNLNSEPSAIAVVVHNLGPQINMDGTLYETNTVTVVDTFVQPLVPSAMPMPSFASASRATATGTSMLNPFAAAAGGGIGQQLQQQQNVQLQGRLVGTQLSLAFSVACRGALVGPGCDLACNSSAANPSSAICQSRRSGFFSLCRWVNGGGGVSAQQVTDCKNCPWGIKENAYCADGQGGVLEPNHAGVVSSSYYTAFVVLCCVCALLLLCMLVACLLACKKVVRARRDAPSSFRRHQQLAAASRAGGNGIATSAPLITRGDPERVLLTAGNARPTESDDGGFNAAFRLGTGVEKGGAKPPPPPYSVRSNGNAAFGTDQRRVAEAALLPDAPSRTSPFALPRSNVASSASGRETPCVVAAGAGGTKNGGAAERHRFPPPLAISNAKIAANSNKTLSPPRFQPLPHLGPQQNQQTRVAAVVGGGGADSLNSSFAGGMAPPSVSADV